MFMYIQRLVSFSLQTEFFYIKKATEGISWPTATDDIKPPEWKEAQSTSCSDDRHNAGLATLNLSDYGLPEGSCCMDVRRELAENFMSIPTPSGPCKLIQLETPIEKPKKNVQPPVPVLERSADKFYCENCELSFTRKTDLNRHMRYSCGKFVYRYLCGYCKERGIVKLLTNRTAAQHHESEQHTGHRKFMCGVCWDSFTSEGKLKTHVRNVHQDQLV